MKRLVVFTAMLGPDTYRVRPPENVTRRARYLCFSDVRAEVPAPYECVPTPPTANPRLESRRIKILADHPLLRQAEATLWHDSSYQLTQDPTWVLRALRRRDLAAMLHPRRRRVEDEGVAIARWGYLTVEQAAAHVTRYREAGFAVDCVTSAGLLARRVSPLMQTFNALWWSEALQWGGRDQASLDFAAWRLGVDMRHLKGTVRSNPFARWRDLAAVTP